MPQELPSHSWNLIVPLVVFAVEVGRGVADAQRHVVLLQFPLAGHVSASASLAFKDGHSRPGGGVGKKCAEADRRRTPIPKAGGQAAAGMRVLSEADGFPRLPTCEIGLIRSCHRPASAIVDKLAEHIVTSLDNLSVPAAAAT